VKTNASWHDRSALGMIIKRHSKNDVDRKRDDRDDISQPLLKVEVCQINLIGLIRQNEYKQQMAIETVVIPKDVKHAWFRKRGNIARQI